MPEKMIFACLVDYVAHFRVAYVLLNIYFPGLVVQHTCYALNKGKDIITFYLLSLLPDRTSQVTEEASLAS